MKINSKPTFRVLLHYLFSCLLEQYLFSNPLSLSCHFPRVPIKICTNMQRYTCVLQFQVLKNTSLTPLCKEKLQKENKLIKKITFYNQTLLESPYKEWSVLLHCQYCDSISATKWYIIKGSNMNAALFSVKSLLIVYNLFLVFCLYLLLD